MFSNYSGNKHQFFANQKHIPLSGGIYLLIGIIYLFYDYDFNFTSTIIIVFFLGFLSDLKVLSSPKVRLIFQLSAIFFSVQILDLQIFSTRIILLDTFLQSIWFNYAFVTFCILILLNGTNFIDGLNGLVLGYYLIILILMYNLNPINHFYYSYELIISLIILFVILLLFNLFNQFFLGDGGSYIIALFFSFILISLSNLNPEISPFFILLLLWYPCFELLFSIIRKIRFNRSPIFPDTNHFHQLLFHYILKKTNKEKTFCNSLVGCIINFFNLMVFLVALNAPHNTQFQIFLILINIILYIVFYLRLHNFKYKNNLSKK